MNDIKSLVTTMKTDNYNASDLMNKLLGILGRQENDGVVEFILDAL